MAKKPAPKRKRTTQYDVDAGHRSLLDSDEQIRLAVETHRRNVDASRSFAALSHKSLTLVSGTAALAILAFLGHVVSNETTSRMSDISVMIPSLYAFGCSAFLGGIIPMLAHFSLVTFLEGGRPYDPLESFFVWGARIAQIVAWMLFAYGLYSAGQAFEGMYKIAGT